MSQLTDLPAASSPHPDGDGPAATPRWQPTRAGLVNVWRYADEVLTFHRGRLLLRGPNGSGKSMALELLLPFLLDANASPHRLTSAAKSRGGLYDRLIADRDGAAPTGFLWLEFGRRGDGHAPGSEVCTIGVRLRASTSNRTVDKAWFVTPQAVGPDLQLLDEARVPLSVKALTEAVEAGGGRVFPTDATAYRARVREVLFPGFSEHRYDAVLSALLALRQEKLSQHLDLDRLSATLTAALPPMDERDVADAAEGFRQLDQRRDNLAQLDADLVAVQSVARQQRNYARQVLQHATTEMIEATSARDTVTKRERESRAQRDQLAGHDQRLEHERTQADLRDRQLDGQIDALKSRDAYTRGADIQPLREETDRSETILGREQRRAGELDTRADNAATRADEATAHVREATRQLAAARDDLEVTADRVGATAALAAGDGEPVDDAERLLSAWSDDRHQHVVAVRGAADEFDAAVRERDERDRDREEAIALRDDREADATSAAEAVDEATTDLRGQLRAWVDRLDVLDRAALADLSGMPADDLDRVDAVIAAAAATVRERLAHLDGELAARDRELADAQAPIQDRRNELAKAGVPEVAAPAWRRDRAQADGAPLWQLLDFRPEVPADHRDRIEAALLAAGLLDAWMAPDGTVHPADGETFAVAGERGGGLKGTTLTAALQAEDHPAVPAAVVTALLDSITLVDTDAIAAPAASAIGRDGTFRLATLSGHGPARPAGFVGATAREQERQRQLAALDQQLADLAAARAAVAADRQQLVETGERLAQELATAPSPDPLRERRDALVRADERLIEADSALATATGRHEAADVAARQAQRQLAATAAEHTLPTDRGGLDRIDGLLRALDRQVAAWASRRRSLDQATRQADEWQADADRARDEAAAQHEAAAEAERHHADLRGRLAALETTVGAPYREVLAQIEEASQERRQLAERARQLEAERREIAGKVARLDERLETLATERDRAEERRTRAHGALAELWRSGFPADAGLHLDADPAAGVTAALETARAVVRELDGVAGDDPAVQRAQARVSDAIHNAHQQLGGRADLTFTLSDAGWWRLRARVDGIEHTITELADILQTDLATARRELEQHEAELYDRTLTEGLRRHLVARIRQATELTDRINGELAQVRTDTSNVAVQLEWKVDDRPGNEHVVGARPLLLRAPGSLTPDETTALHEFVRGRVEQVRDPEDGNALTWEDRLTRAFDYRDWHRFGLKVSHRAWGGEFRPATPKRLQQLSTGERSIVLHLPMLASVAAHYDDPDEPSRCPRLILLDELFVGVDPVNRAQLFGMFVEWDLDAVLTSDHEWCRYATLDGIAIHQVHGDTDPVVTSRFVWDGNRTEAAASVPA